jgi:hypothetical protein
VRHEVVQVAVVTAVSCRTHGIRQDATRSSATGILPGRASLVILRLRSGQAGGVRSSGDKCILHPDRDGNGTARRRCDC